MLEIHLWWNLLNLSLKSTSKIIAGFLLVFFVVVFLYGQKVHIFEVLQKNKKILFIKCQQEKTLRHLTLKMEASLQLQ